MTVLIYFAAITLALFYLIIGILNLVFCAPSHNESWIAALGSSKCNQAKTIGVVAGIIGITSDFYILLLPLPAIWKLKLATRKRIGVSLILLTGFM